MAKKNNREKPEESDDAVGCADVNAEEMTIAATANVDVETQGIASLPDSEHTEAAAPASVVLKEGWFWVGQYRFNTQKKAQEFFEEKNDKKKQKKVR
jgi:hypothetical protein